MEWTPEHIRLLRKHLGDNQQAFAERIGLRRRFTVTEWEAGRVTPGGPILKLFDMIAREVGFSERVAGRLRREIERE